MEKLRNANNNTKSHPQFTYIPFQSYPNNVKKIPKTRFGNSCKLIWRQTTKRRRTKQLAILLHLFGNNSRKQNKQQQQNT